MCLLFQQSLYKLLFASQLIRPVRVHCLKFRLITFSETGMYNNTLFFLIYMHTCYFVKLPKRKNSFCSCVQYNMITYFIACILSINVQFKHLKFIKLLTSLFNILMSNLYYFNTYVKFCYAQLSSECVITHRSFNKPSPIQIQCRKLTSTRNDFYCLCSFKFLCSIMCEKLLGCINLIIVKMYVIQFICKYFWHHIFSNGL